MAIALRSSLDRLAFGRPVASIEATARVAPRPATALAGRFLLSAIFILSGIMKFANYDQTLGYMRAEGIPWTPALLVIAALVEIIGGLSILSGLLTRIGALALIVFLIPTTLVFHDFWAYSGAERSMQTANFMKNLAIMGGLLLLTAFGGGRYAVDSEIHHPPSPR
jgi:putative oxidoreductase